ncbi:MAG: FeoC-like transcriptional regulator [Anaerolineales bacterium]|jgi:hypothetical protein
MTKTLLKKVLEYIEGSRSEVSILALARELDISVGHAQNLVDFWVRKGHLQSTSEISRTCQGCGSGGTCPFH